MCARGVTHYLARVEKYLNYAQQCFSNVSAFNNASLLHALVKPPLESRINQIRKVTPALNYAGSC